MRSARFQRMTLPLLLAVGGLLAPRTSKAAGPPVPTTGGAILTIDSQPGDTTTGGAGQPAQWRTEMIDLGGTMPALQLGSDGAPRVAYFHVGSGTLRYATRGTDRWISEVVATAIEPRSGEYLVLDRADGPHIFYGNKTGELWYATRTTQGWTTERVAVADRWYGLVTAAIDGNGQPHLFYADNDQLQYITKSASGWTPPQALPVYFPNPVSVTAGSDGRLHLGVNDDSDLKYAVLDRGVWKFSAPLAEGGGSMAVAVDRRDQPLVCLPLETGLSVGSQDASGWKFQSVDPTGGQPLNMAVDHTHRTHLMYRSTGIKYAVHNGQKWLFEVVAPTARAGFMVIDAHDRPQIVFDSDGVRYAVRTKALRTSADVIGDNARDQRPMDLSSAASSALGAPQAAIAHAPYTGPRVN